MSHPLISRLDRHGPLSDEEKDVLREVTARVRDYGARQDIVREGDSPSESCLILEGFACRHNHLADGRRQITAIHISGDFAEAVAETGTPGTYFRPHREGFCEPIAPHGLA